MSAKFEIHFHDKVEQNINNVEHMDVHLGKDSKFQVMNAEGIYKHLGQTPQPSNKADAAILAAFDSGICESPDWCVVLRLFQERNIKRPNNLPYDAQYINELCGQEVTNARSISRAFMTDSIEGKYPNWRVKAGYETRESPNLLRHYYEIAKIVVDVLGE